jgi:hypothetical protein
MMNFILEGHINHILCDKIIEHFKNDPNKYVGLTSNEKKEPIILLTLS